MEICEFCGSKVKRIEGTSFVGAYCVECHRLNRAESLDAIKRIQNKPIIKSQKAIKQQEKEREMAEILKQVKDTGKPFDTSVFFRGNKQLR